MTRMLCFLVLACGALAADVVDPGDCHDFPCLIFNDEFHTFDHDVWEHEITMSGGGNWEFQVYLDNRSVSYTRDSTLFITPELTSNWKSEEFLTCCELDLKEACTESAFYGCARTGNSVNIINPIMSARIRTLPSFSFKYGRLEVRAKMPRGDWLWPAIWLMPKNSPYGRWPVSGSIGIAESRGNNDYGNLGHQYAESNLHWGPNSQVNLYPKTHAIYQAKNGSLDNSQDKNESFANSFHTWRLDWTKDSMKFYLDDELQLTVDPGTNFWEFSGLGSSQNNPWRDGSKMAPFDQKFYLILNLAVGGVNGYFPDTVSSNPPKPWKNSSPHAARDFWNDRGSWLPSWEHGEGRISENAALKVDYVKVWKMESVEQ